VPYTVILRNLLVHREDVRAACSFASIFLILQWGIHATHPLCNHYA
jgi:hypothetical protein